MSVREMMNRNPAMAGTIAVVLVLAAIAAAWYSLKPDAQGAPTKAYYTIDDGQSWFADRLDRPTPFEHDGKEAVKAYVYTCDGGRSQFVAYLEKMPAGPKPAAQVKEAEPAAAPKSEAEARAMAAKQPRKPAVGQFAALVKKPGDKQWLTSADPRYFPTIAPRCPDASAKVDRVFP